MRQGLKGLRSRAFHIKNKIKQIKLNLNKGVQEKGICRIYISRGTS